MKKAAFIFMLFIGSFVTAQAQTQFKDYQYPQKPISPTIIKIKPPVLKI